MEWYEEQFHKKQLPIEGDVGIVTAPVEVYFAHSDKIIEAYDDDGVPQYTSGLVMHVKPQTIIYSNEHLKSYIPLYTTFKEQEELPE